MAELRRNAGGMEPARGPQYRKALLPWESQVCETLGIDEKDYFEYFDLVAQYRKEEQGREFIPDIRNDPVTTGIVLTVVGVALQAVSYLLAPKPRSPEQKQQQGQSFQGQDVKGRTKYAPLAEFDSIQDLATLGSLIPLIYTKRRDDHGGVRAESRLIWSRMRNLSTYQELRALLLYSAGEIKKRPDWEGYAFGNSKITGYMAAKLALWFSRGLSKENGNQLFAMGDTQEYKEGTKYEGRSPGARVFLTSFGGKRRMMFCGAVTPSQSSVFGQYSPIRNGHGWKYSFKYPGKGDGDIDQKERIMATRRKHCAGYHAGRTTFTRSGDTYTYRIKDARSNKIFQACVRDAVNPDIETENHFSGGKLNVRSVVKENDNITEKIGGLTEGITSIEQSQIDADMALDVGELYLIGSDIYRCVGRSDRQTYEPRQGNSVEYYFEIQEEFEKDYVSSRYILVDDDEDVYNEKHMPIQKVAIGSIATTRPVDMVEIGFKSTVYRQIQGYTNIAEFSEQDITDLFAKDNSSFQFGTITAYYDRVTLFRMEIKRGNNPWFDWSGGTLFAIHGKNPQAMFNQINIQVPKKDFYQFRFIPVAGNAWIGNNNYKDRLVFVLDGSRSIITFDTRKDYKVSGKGIIVKIDDEYNMDHPYWATGEKSRRNQNPNSLLNDFWYFDADTASHANEPEHSITWINEYVENSDEWYEDDTKNYEHLAYAGLVCQSSKEISTFSNFSAYFKEGIIVRRFLNEGSVPYAATNNFPEIAYDLLTNRRYGVGEYIGTSAVNEKRFNKAAEFCNANGFYWDGVISEKTNVREFLFTQAAYQLLDFTILGGQFSLYPTVPFNSDGTIAFDACAGDSNFLIKALFTDGNVRNFKTTFLSPEERQLFIAEVKYREEEENGFPETHVTRIRLSDKDGGYYRDPVEVFDMTQFCTRRRHAINFAKYALRVRQLVDHSVSFETTPDAAHTLSPGDYIRVGVGVMHAELDRGYTARLRTGSVAPNGTLQINKHYHVDPDGFDVYYWKPCLDGIRVAKLKERDGVVLDTALHGSLFTRKRTEMEVRIYKIESMTYTEDSFVDITASYIPTTPEGKMSLLDWGGTHFVIEDQQS